MYGNIDILEEHFANFNKMVHAENFIQNENLQSLIFLTHYNTLMNIHFVKGEFFTGTKLIPEVELKMEKLRERIDEHHFMILYLKMAAMFFGSKMFDKSIEYSMRVIESKGNVQEDLLFHTRILILMAKYESGNDEDYDEFIASTLKFAKKMKKPEEFHFESIQFFKNLNNQVLDQRQKAFENFDKKLEAYSKNEYYRRSLFYIDIHGWIKSKVQNVDVIEIIKQKVKYKKNIK